MTRIRPREAAVWTALAVFAATSCSIDGLLEGPQPATPVRIDVSAATTTLSLAPGDSTTLTVTATRADGSHGALTFTVGLPAFFTATVGEPSTSGATSTVAITIRAGANVSPVSYYATVHVAAAPAGDANLPLVLNVARRPAITVTPLLQTVTVIPGGRAPFAVSITRTVVTDPVALTLTGPAGIALGAPTDAVAGTTATATLTVAATVAPGTYEVTLHGAVANGPTADTPFTVVVRPDPLQVLLGDVAAAQATIASVDVIVNRNGADGAVTFSADGLPGGVSFAAAPAAGASATATFSVAAGASPGTYAVTLRAAEDGGANASTSFALTIAASNVAMTLVPQSVAVLQGGTAASLLTVVRTTFDGAVAITLSGVPDGITITPTETTVTGSTTTLILGAASDAPPGTYMVTVRAVPPAAGPGGPALDPASALLSVTVVAAPVGGGNVTLDWSRCAAPGWVAAQDGEGAWTQVAGSGGFFQFALASSRGGIAYTTRDGAVTVRYATNTEWTAGPVDMCDPAPPAPGTRTVTGAIEFPALAVVGATANVFYTWHFGGGGGTTSLAAQPLVISGVRAGTHDLVGVGAYSSGGAAPMVLIRDITPTAAGDIGNVTIGDASSSFAPLAAGVDVGPPTGERLLMVESYLTTAACTANEIAQAGQLYYKAGSYYLAQIGVPELYQRPTDFHHVEVTASSDTGSRFASLSYHSVYAGQMNALALPPKLPPYSVAVLSGSNLRLRVSLSAVPGAYAGGTTLQFGDGAATMTVLVSQPTLDAAGSGIFLLDTPDFSGVTGLPAGAVPAAGAHGAWTLRFSGSSGAPTDCAEGASRWWNVRKGTF